jgi:diguanylate cyclase (GGDEF)-like protein
MNRRSHQLLTPSAMIALAVVVASFIVALCSIVLYQERLDALAHARDASRNVALMAERDIEGNFEFYALALQAAVDGVNDPQVMAAPERVRRRLLFDRATTANYVGSMLIVDAHGDLVAESDRDVPMKLNFADRKYFIIQRDNPGVGLYVSDPLASRVRGGPPIITLSRRISRRDGSFGGVAIVAVDLEYFRKLFSELGLGPHGAIVLDGRDGVMVMRQPYNMHVIGRDMSQTATFRKYASRSDGSFCDTSTIDGVRRFFYFRNFPNLPLVIAVTESTQDIFSTWRTRALTIGLLVFLFAVGFVGLSLLLAAQLRRRIKVENELALLAQTDGLTGLYNRRTLVEILNKEWRRARRTRSVLSLLFVDIDRFKAYNDTYGHQAGDDALAAVGQCISENIRRPADTAARYGGEEFVVVLPNTDASGAAHIAEKIRAAVSDLNIEHAGSEFGRVTATVGAASTMPEGDSDVSAMIRTADEALYSAKTTGRNKVGLSDVVVA